MEPCHRQTTRFQRRSWIILLLRTGEQNRCRDFGRGQDVRKNCLCIQGGVAVLARAAQTFRLLFSHQFVIVDCHSRLVKSHHLLISLHARSTFQSYAKDRNAGEVFPTDEVGLTTATPNCPIDQRRKRRETYRQEYGEIRRSSGTVPEYQCMTSKQHTKNPSRHSLVPWVRRMS